MILFSFVHQSWYMQRTEYRNLFNLSGNKYMFHNTFRWQGRGFQIPDIPLVGVQAGLGAGNSLAVGKARMHLLSGPQLCLHLP
jgi:hypothetical protein